MPAAVNGAARLLAMGRGQAHSSPNLLYGDALMRVRTPMAEGSGVCADLDIMWSQANSVTGWPEVTIWSKNKDGIAGEAFVTEALQECLQFKGDGAYISNLRPTLEAILAGMQQTRYIEDDREQSHIYQFATSLPLHSLVASKSQAKNVSLEKCQRVVEAILDVIKDGDKRSPVDLRCAADVA